ncbi:hypothetical protein LLG95_13345 [bacterium]|nr:hypothetical protein [bacterium]
MLRDLTPDQIRLELDRMIPYLEERLVEFHIVETEEPLTPADDLSEDRYDDSSDDFSEDFSEEEISDSPSPEPNPSSIIPKNRSR